MRQTIIFCLAMFIAQISGAQVKNVPNYLLSKDANYGLNVMLGTRGDKEAYNAVRKYVNEQFRELGMHIGAYYFLDSALATNTMTAMVNNQKHFSKELVNVRIDLKVSDTPGGKKLVSGKAGMADFKKITFVISIFEGTEPHTGTYDATAGYSIQGGSDLVSVMETFKNDVKSQPAGYFLSSGGVPVYYDYQVYPHFPRDLDKSILAVVTYPYPLAGLGQDRYAKIMEDYPFPYELIAPEAWESQKDKYKYMAIWRDEIRQYTVRYIAGDKAGRSEDKADQDFYFLIQDVAKGDIYMGEKEFKVSEGMGGALKRLVERVREEFGMAK